MTIDSIAYVRVLNWKQYLHKKALFLKTLSFLEVEKLKNFLSQYDRDKFLITRGLLRTLLGQLIACSPEQCQLVTTKFGKLRLLDNAYFFNLSHTKDWVAYAFCKDKALGIDIEHQNNYLAINKIAKRYFSENENKVLANLQYNKHVFFSAWVHKEAIVKALGVGLQCPLSYISLDLNNLAKPSTYRLCLLGRKKPILLHPLNVPMQLKGALAILTDAHIVIQEIKENVL